MDYVIETIDSRKRYGTHPILSELSLHVPRGAIYGLLGPNGAGKTTVLKLVVGLLRPTSGRVQLFGEPWRRDHLSRVGALIETPGLFRNLTGPENLAVHTELLGLPKGRIPEALERVGLAGVGKKLVGACSLGMKQRLGIAIALIGRPDLLVLDEPTNGLAPVGIKEMRELMRGLQAEGLTVVVSSHLLAEIAQVVTHVGILADEVLRYEGDLDGLIGKRVSRVVVETPRPAEALAVLRGRYEGVRVEDGRVVVPVGEGDVVGPLLALARAALPVTHFAHERADLEGAFLRLINGSPKGQDDARDGRATNQPEVISEASR